MVDLVEIGKRIKTIRLESNLTQNMIGEYLLLDQSMIAKMEKGERNITSDVIEKLSELFCCSVDYILYGDNMGEKCNILFRTSSLTSEDLKALATINRIVLNQFEMDKMLEGACK